MDKFQGTEQERQAALEDGITATSDLLDKLTAALEAEPEPALAGMETVASETRAAVEGLERMLDLGELDALADELGVAV